MDGAAAALFETLGRAGRHPLLEQAHGTLRFEVEGARTPTRWTVAFEHGAVKVSHANRTADCTVRTSEELLDGLASGEVNAMAAVLRGAVAVEGDPELFLRFQRVFPGPS